MLVLERYGEGIEAISSSSSEMVRTNAQIERWSYPDEWILYHSMKYSYRFLLTIAKGLVGLREVLV